MINAILVEESFDTGFHVFNLGTGTGHSVKEIVAAIEAASGRTIPTIETGRRDGDVGMCISLPRSLNGRRRRLFHVLVWISFVIWRLMMELK